MESGKKSTLINSWNKINDKKCKDIVDEVTSDNLVELVHQIDGYEEMTET